MAISTAIPPSQVARALGIKTEFKDFRQGGILFLPQQMAVVGQGSSAVTYSTDKAQYTSATAVASTYGYGSPLHLAAMQIFPVNGDGVGTIPVTFYPLEDDVSGVASTGDVTPGGVQTEAAAYRVVVNEILSEEFVINVGDSAADIVTAAALAVNAVLEMPVIATADTTPAAEKVDCVSKWAGTSANSLSIKVVGSTIAGTTWGITQPVGGLVNPNVQPALDQVGNVWETMFLNCLEVVDTTNLDRYQTFGDGRWGATVRKPAVVFSGDTSTTVALATTTSDARKTDRVNAQLVAPSSENLPFVVAARELARIIVRANENPAYDYGSLPATGLTPGPDGDQWDNAARDEAVKKGSSTTEVRDGVIYTSDTVTFYHPTGDPLPAYRFVVDIVKLQNIIFNIELEFIKPEWDGAPLVPDDQTVVNPAARKPKSAKAAVSGILDSLAENALISDPETAKDNTLFEIDAMNPKRLNGRIPVQLSGNVNIKSIDLDFGFFFGTPAVVA